MISSRVKKFIEKYNLSGTFVVAFSGGYDSMCLLDVLDKCGYDTAAVHLNHNWRGEESIKEAKVCENFAKSRNIKFYSEILSDTVEKTETAAREARYKFFERCAEKFNSKVVFTAHNYDDNAETVLYRIIKGTGIYGLQGIAENRDIFYRPLLKTSRNEIEAYCLENNLKPNSDSSNFDTKYNRNLIRHKIKPILREINPKVTDALNSLSELAKEHTKIIENLENNINKAEPLIQKCLIHNLLSENKIDYDRKKIEKIRKFIEENKDSKSGKKFSIGNDLWLFTNKNTTEIISKTQKKTDELKITQTGKYEFEDYIFEIEPFENDIKTFPADKDFKAYININKIDFVLRHRRNGDIIQPLGLEGTQKFKKYLNEKKIPQHKKDDIILLCNKNEIFWAAGLGLSEKVKVTQKPTHVITLRSNDGY